MKTIRSVRVIHECDDAPDLSHLGNYTNKAGPDDKTIDRRERGDWSRGEYQYFVAAMSGSETGNPASVEQDYNRMEDYNRGGWGMIGIRAVADVQFTEHGPIQRISSGGLWGIESDSGKSYFDEIATEQLDELRGVLRAAGFSARQISKAFRQRVQVPA